MPVITMPDGVNVDFPDDMPRSEIQSLILSKFPDVAKSNESQPESNPEQPLSKVGIEPGLLARATNQEVDNAYFNPQKPQDKGGVKQSNNSAADDLDEITKRLDGRSDLSPEAQSVQELGNHNYADRQRYNEKPKAKHHAFNESNPNLSAFESGTANLAAGVADSPQLVNDAIKQYGIDPFLNLFGFNSLKPTPRFQIAKDLDQMSKDYTPEIVNKKLDDLRGADEWGSWIAAQASMQSPQLVASTAAGFIPKLRSAYLGFMGVTSASGNYQDDLEKGINQKTSMHDSIINGGFEVLGEMLPFGALDEVIKRVPKDQVGSVISNAIKKTMVVVGAGAVQHIAEASGEAFTQLGQNASKRYVVGDKTVGLMDQVPESALIGGIMGAPTAIGQSYHAATTKREASEGNDNITADVVQNISQSETVDQAISAAANGVNIPVTKKKQIQSTQQGGLLNFQTGYGSVNELAEFAATERADVNQQRKELELRQYEALKKQQSDEKLAMFEAIRQKDEQVAQAMAAPALAAPVTEEAPAPKVVQPSFDRLNVAEKKSAMPGNRVTEKGIINKDGKNVFKFKEGEYDALNARATNPDNGAVQSVSGVVLPVNGVGARNAVAGNGDTVVGGGVVAGQQSEPSSAESVDAGSVAGQSAADVSVKQLRENLNKADAENDLDGIYDASQALDKAVSKVVKGKLDSGEMPVFKGKNGLTYAVHPATDGGHSYQVTMYNDNGAQGDTRYKTIDHAIKDSRISNLDMLEGDAANAEMDRLAKAEGEYQARRKAAASVATPEIQVAVDNAQASKAAPQSRTKAVTDERMSNDGHRAALKEMKAEFGWAEIGGKLIRGADGEAASRTKWLPLDERAIWGSRPDKNVSEHEAHQFVNAALAGKEIPAKGHRFINYLLDISAEREKQLNAIEQEIKTEEDTLSNEDHERLDAAMVAAEDMVGAVRVSAIYNGIVGIEGKSQRQINSELIIAFKRETSLAQEQLDYEKLTKAESIRGSDQSVSAGETGENARASNEEVSATDTAESSGQVRGGERRDDAHAAPKLEKRKIDRRLMTKEQIIAEADALDKELDKIKYTSPLTGLPNRLAHDESVKSKFAASADIDGMKTVNDTLGHTAGDSLIIAMASALKDAAIDYPSVRVYHQSGDEFIAQSDSLEDLNAAMKQAQKVLFDGGYTYKDLNEVEQHKKGTGFSYGTGNSYKDADSNLDADKKARKAAGLRTGERDVSEAQEEEGRTDRGDEGNVTARAEEIPDSVHREDGAGNSSFALTSQTNAQVAKQEADAAKAKAKAEKEAPSKNVTADQVDLFNPQDSLINSNRENPAKNDEAKAKKLEVTKAQASGQVTGDQAAALKELADAGETAAVDAVLKPEENPSQISDFGEKLEGAKKDLWKTYQKAMSDQLPDDPADITLAKNFPEPDYENLIASGVSIKALAIVKAMRDSIGSKPFKSYKVSRWVSELTTLREFANDIITGKNNADNVLEQLKNLRGTNIAEAALLYEQLGYPTFSSAKGYRISSGWTELNENMTEKAKRIGMADPNGRVSFYDSYDDAVNALRAKLEVKPKKTGRSVTLDRYRTTAGDFIIGKKVASNKYIDLKGGFKSFAEARAYQAEHEAELLELLAKKKEVAPERRSTNNPRIGKDYRLGEDVTPEKFAAEFGFRGVQFGNYVEQVRRVKDLNNAFDALLDLANLIGIPTRAISLNGSLGLAFGARGSGGRGAAAAHYEAGDIVINLTKANGAGSLGHEWFHAMDNYFGKSSGGNDSFMTNRRKLGTEAIGEVRQEVAQAFGDVMRAIRGSSYFVDAHKLDKRRSKDYWSTDIELSARAFEAYLVDKAAKNGESSDYLANIISEESHDILNGMAKDVGLNAEPYPYPRKVDMEKINPLFEKLFSTLKTEETDKGIALYSQSETKASNPFTLSTIKQAIDKAFSGTKNFTDKLLATGKFSLIESKDIEQHLGDGAKFSKESQTDTPEFKKWFGDSKVVDADGNPLVVYHGSTRGGISISSIQTSFFTDSKDVATTYSLDGGSSGGDNPTVQGIYLKMSNPLEIDAGGEEWMRVPFEGGRKTIDNISNIAGRRGYDGLVVRNVYDNVNDEDLPTSTVYVTVGKVTQIKSATDNNGQFDPSNSDIHYSKDGRILAFVKDGHTYLVADNISSTDDNIKGLIGHEIGLHALQLGRSDKEFQAILKQLEKLKEDGSIKVIAAFNRVPKDTASHLVTEEAAGYLIEKHPELTISQKIIAWFKQALRKLGFNMPFSTTDIVAMAMSATRSAPSTLGKANREGTYKADTQSQFYSQLRKVMRDAPEKIFSNGKQVAAWLESNAAKNGIKKDELFWTGIGDWLNMQGKVSKDDVLAYLDANGVQVKDVMLGRDLRKELTTTEYRNLDEQQRRQLPGYDYATGLDIVVLHNNVPVFSTQGTSRKDSIDIYMSTIGEAESSIDGVPKFATYVVPGGSDYRELLITLPINEKQINGLTVDGVAKSLGYSGWHSDLTKEQEAHINRVFNAQKDRPNTGNEQRPNTFSSSHYDTPNILAHLRFDTRTDAQGRKVMFIQEIQSDWGQKGKKEGFSKTADKSELDAMKEEMSALNRRATSGPQLTQAEYARLDELIKLTKAGVSSTANTPGVPSAPFVNDTKSWLSLALKKAISHAVENGHEVIAWANGEQNAGHYNLSKQVKGVSAKKWESGTFGITYTKIDGERELAGEFKPEELEGVVGKELANRIIEDAQSINNGDIKHYTMLDLKVGGEGMKAFYDQIVPQAANEVLKKVGGGKVESIASDTVGASNDKDGSAYQNQTQQIVTITPELRAKVINEGMPLFSKQDKIDWEFLNDKVESGEELTREEKKKRDRIGRLVKLYGGKSDYENFRVLETAWHSGLAASGFLGHNYSAEESATVESLRKTSDRIARSIADKEGLTPIERLDDDAHLVWEHHVDSPLGHIKSYAVKFQYNNVATGNILTKEEYENTNSPYERTMLFIADGIKTKDPFLTVTISQSGELLIHGAKEGSSLFAYMESKGWAELATDKDGAVAKYGDGTSWTRMTDVTGIQLRTLLARIHAVSRVTAGTDQEGVYWTRATGGSAKTGDDSNILGRSGAVMFSKAQQSLLSNQNSIANNPSWEAPEPTQLDNLIYKLQDKHVDMKRIVEEIKNVGLIDADSNPYDKEELFHGRAAKRTEDFAKTELKPLIDEMRMRKISVADIDQYLHARHAEEANMLIADRNPDIQDGGSGMTDQQAKDYFKSLSAEQKNRLEGVAKRVDAILEKTRKLYVEYGLVSQAQADGWAGMFDHYVPLMREDHDGGMGVGQGFSIKGKEVKHRTGSTAKVVDILANIALQREKAITRGEKNAVSKALVELVELNPNADFWTTKNLPEQVFNEKTGLVEDHINNMYKNMPNVITAKVVVKGKVVEKAVIFNEHDERAMRMAEAMKNLDAAGLNGVLAVSATITRYFASVNTQYNPVFGLTNITRDIQDMLINLDNTPLKDHKAEVAKQIPEMIKGIYLSSRLATKGKESRLAPVLNMFSTKNNAANAKLWEELQDEGGMTGYRDMFANSADRAKAIEHELDPHNWVKSKWGKVFTAGGALKVPMTVAQDLAAPIFDWLSDYNQTLEGATRLSVYKVAIDNGLTKAEAASLAKNITINFNRKGAVGQQAGALFAFFNAAVQGTARIGQTIFDMDKGDIKTLRLNSTGKKVVYGGILLGAMQAVMLAAAGFDDDEPPEFVREKSLIIPTGNKKYISIPMPLGFSVLPNMGRIPTQWAIGGFKNTGKTVVNMLSTIVNTFNPLGSTGFSMQTITPTALDPLEALSSNKDWNNRPIANVSFNKTEPGFLNNKDTSTKLGKLIAEGINTLTFGDKYTRGGLSPTADQIDYLGGQLGGGVWREGSKVEQAIVSLFTGEDLPLYKRPILGRFYGDANSQAGQSGKFYSNLAHVQEVEAGLEGRMKDRLPIDKFKLENREYRMISEAKNVDKELRKLRSDKRKLIEQGGKKEVVKRIEERITMIMQNFNEHYDKVSRIQP
jgi:GGDEF domain-containing protein